MVSDTNGKNGKHHLPDSRAQDPTGSVMADWKLPGGKTVRVECEMIYCANCGKEYGYVPKENTTFAFYLCTQCHEKYGDVAGTYAQPDEEFNAAVAHELEERFGPGGGTTEEIFRAYEKDELGPALKALLKDSPYPSELR